MTKEEKLPRYAYTVRYRLGKWFQANKFLAKAKRAKSIDSLQASLDHNKYSDFATDEKTQRRRKVFGPSKQAVASAKRNLEQEWRNEAPVSEPKTYRSQQWHGRQLFEESIRRIGPTKTKNWKAEALEKLAAYPSPRKAPSAQIYESQFGAISLARAVPNEIFLEQLQSSEEFVHLGDYDAILRSITEARASRIAEKLIRQKHYPVVRPVPKGFPEPPSLPEKRPLPSRKPEFPVAEERWWHAILPMWEPKPSKDRMQAYESALSRFDGRRSDVLSFNKWIDQLWEDRRCYWKWKKEKFEQACKVVDAVWVEHSNEWSKALKKEMLILRGLTDDYKSGAAGAVISFFRAHLDAIPLPSWCLRKYFIEYDEATRILLVELQLPYLDDLEIKKTRQLKYDSKIVPATQKESRQFRDNILYLLALRYLWEIACVDVARLLQLVCINGYVTYADPAIGRPRTDTILSVSAKPEDLREILLDRVDPKQCFKSLKGVAGARLSELVPVQPIIRFDKADSRFVVAKDVLDDVGDRNLATMDWQEFEYLIREIFEKAFVVGGAEVKVTQASRDRGVDAIVFDPDPLRGGKYVIQAKRYTHVVDVSAVRDLYGTVMNEGANKGILVTTSNYGRDAYEFAKDKPLTLMNGSNLLHLLEKHGYKLKIDLKEAKRLLKENGGV